MRCKEPFRPIGRGAEAAPAVFVTFDALSAGVLAGAVGSVGVLNSGYGIIGVFQHDADGLCQLVGPLHLNLCDGSEFTLATSGANINYTRTGGAPPTWAGTPGPGGGLVITDGVVQLAFLNEQSAEGSITLACTFVPTVTTTALDQVLGGGGFSRKAGAQSVFADIYEATGWKVAYHSGAITGYLAQFGNTYLKDTVATGVEVITSCTMMAGRITAAGTAEFSWLIAAYAGDNAAGAGDPNYVLGNIGLTTAPLLDWIPCLVTYKKTGNISARYKTVRFLSHPRPGGYIP